MTTKTPRTDETARRSNTLIASLAIQEYDHLTRQLETKLTELAAAAKDVQDSIIAAANHEGREQNWMLKLRRMSEAIAAAMPNAARDSQHGVVRGKYTLLLSQKASALRAPNRAKTNDGKEVEYTCMVEEAVCGPWRENYKWDDAEVVGYVESYDQITHV